jgi:hypothetical protein
LHLNGIHPAAGALRERIPPGILIILADNEMIRIFMPTGRTISAVNFRLYDIVIVINRFSRYKLLALIGKRAGIFFSGTFLGYS